MSFLSIFFFEFVIHVCFSRALTDISRYAVLFRTNSLTEISIASTRTPLLTLIGATLGIVGTLTAIFIFVKRRAFSKRCGRVVDNSIVLALTCGRSRFYSFKVSQWGVAPSAREDNELKAVNAEAFGARGLAAAKEASGSSTNEGDFCAVSPLPPVKDCTQGLSRKDSESYRKILSI